MQHLRYAALMGCVALAWPAPAGAAGRGPSGSGAGAASEPWPSASMVPFVRITVRGTSALPAATATPTTEGPPRVFIDLPGVGPGQVPASLTGRAIVRRVRVALNSADPPVTRLVLDLAGPVTTAVVPGDSELTIVVAPGAAEPPPPRPSADRSMGVAPAAPARLTERALVAPTPAPASASPPLSVGAPRQPAHLPRPRLPHRLTGAAQSAHAIRASRRRGVDRAAEIHAADRVSARRAACARTGAYRSIPAARGRRRRPVPLRATTTSPPPSPTSSPNATPTAWSTASMCATRRIRFRAAIPACRCTPATSAADWLAAPCAPVPDISGSTTSAASAPWPACSWRGDRRPSRPRGLGRWRGGLFGGLDPNVYKFGYSEGVRKAGAYMTLEGARGRRHVAGYVNVHNGSLTERSVMTFTNFVPAGPLFVYQAAEYDVAGTAGGLGHKGLTYFFGNARVSAGRRAGVPGHAQSRPIRRHPRVERRPADGPGRIAAVDRRPAIRIARRPGHGGGAAPRAGLRRLFARQEQPRRRGHRAVAGGRLRRERVRHRRRPDVLEFTHVAAHGQLSLHLPVGRARAGPPRVCHRGLLHGVVAGPLHSRRRAWSSRRGPRPSGWASRPRRCCGAPRRCSCPRNARWTTATTNGGS